MIILYIKGKLIVTIKEETDKEYIIFKMEIFLWETGETM